MKTFVIDTSALLRLYLPDGPLEARSEEAMESAHRGNVVISAPDLLFAEAAQVLLKKERSKLLIPEEAQKIQKEISALPIDIVAHKELIDLAGQLARAHNLTIYDALFLTLAQKLRCPLLTCDEKLVRVHKAIV